MIAAGDNIEALRAEHEALIQFLYQAPVGLVQCGMDGAIVMINPISAQLLMPLSADGNLANLFDTLEHVAPGLRLQCAQYPVRNGKIFEGQHIHVRHLGAHNLELATPQILSFTLLKLDDMRLIAVIKDVTAEQQRERQRRRSGACSAGMTGTTASGTASASASASMRSVPPIRFSSHRIR